MPEKWVLPSDMMLAESISVEIQASPAERKLGTHFELESDPSHFPRGSAGPIGQWSQNFRCPVLATYKIPHNLSEFRFLEAKCHARKRSA